MSDKFHAWRCRECGTYFGDEEINKPGGCCHSALHCPKCNSSQVEELTPGELLGLYRDLEMKLFRERNAALYMAATMKDGIDILVRRMHLSDSVYVGRMQEAVVNYENLNSGEIEMRKAEEEMQRPSMTREQIEEYLRNAENKAIKSLAQNKWERFGYWASQSVHLRRLLGLSRTRSPFRPFADLARQMVDAQSE